MTAPLSQPVSSVGEQIKWNIIDRITAVGIDVVSTCQLAHCRVDGLVRGELLFEEVVGLARVLRCPPAQFFAPRPEGIDPSDTRSDAPGASRS